MTLMMNYFDEKYDFEFLMNTSKPDIYKMEFNEEQLMNVEIMESGIKLVVWILL